MSSNTKQADFLPEGVCPAAWSVLACLILAAILALVVALSRCSRPAPPYVHLSPQPSPVVQATAIASSSTRVVATQGTQTVIEWEEDGDTGQSEATASHPVKPARHRLVITTTSTQSVIVEASASAGASASVVPVVKDSLTTDHGRLGVIAGIVPGVVALDLEAARVDLPVSLVGMPLELGLDLEGNQQEAGAGISLGSKAFLEAGAFSTWSLGGPGWFGAVGLRF